MRRVCKPYDRRNSSGQVIISVYNKKALKPRLESYRVDELTQSKVTRQETVYTTQGLFSEQFTFEKLARSLEKGFGKDYFAINDLTSISYRANGIK